MNQEIIKQEDPLQEIANSLPISNESVREMSLWQRLWGVISNPVETLAIIGEKPSVLWPIVSISLLNLMAFGITLPKLKEFLLITYENMPKQQYTAEQLTAMKAYMGGAAAYSAGAAIVLTPLLIWVVYVLIFKFVNFFTGQEAPFKNLYAVTVISSVPTILGSFLRSILVATSSAENYDKITTSAALMLPKGTTGPLFAFLTNIDPFHIWSLILLAIGAASVLKISTKKSGIIVFIIWAFMAGMSVLFASLSPKV